MQDICGSVIHVLGSRSRFWRRVELGVASTLGLSAEQHRRGVQETADFSSTMPAQPSLADLVNSQNVNDPDTSMELAMVTQSSHFRALLGA
jgi:hypothetical protein